VCKGSEIELIKLRISQAYSKLLCIPGTLKVVSLARFGSHEVRMVGRSQNQSAALLFSLELFDHDAQWPVDSCSCYGIEEGVAAFQHLISR
jgi:hypothetical protein